MRHITFVSTYPPRVCGIASFTSDLREALTGTGEWTASVVAMEVSPPEEGYSSEVERTVHHDAVEEYAAAAEVINRGPTDIVSLQHEFGIFGGPEGLYVTELLSRISKPVVTTLHTVLPEPALPYRRALQTVARFSDQLVVMTETARELLRDVYGIPTGRVHVIPHGVPEIAPGGSTEEKAALGLSGRTVLLTFGLLSPGKGIEFVLNTLPDLVSDHPDLLYLILGVTHPEVRRRSGESYRTHLMERVDRLGLTEHVRFLDQYVSQDELLRYLRACDVYITPYPGQDQASSGTLTYALAAGKAIVSTPYLYAREVLADDAGRLVPYGDTESLAEILRILITDEDERAALERRAYRVAASMRWREVARQYARLFEETTARGRSVEPRPTSPALPRIALTHLKRLTDSTGLFQHAPLGIPDRNHGYCTDDVGRAMVVLLHHYERTGEPSSLPLVRTYLSFLRHAQTENGAFRNELGFDRRFVDESGSEDTTGRALWGLGAAVAWMPDPSLRQLARQMVERAREVPLHHPRALAYGICGLALFLRRHEGATRTHRRLIEWAEQLITHYRGARRPNWPWFHDAITYGNAILPRALLEAYRLTGRSEFLEIGTETLDFLLETTYDETGFFDFVGNEGWFPRGGSPAPFAQQTIEAGYTAEACAAAHAATGKKRYEELARAAADWLSGRNRLGVRLYDPATGACADGLEIYGASLNQGAESTISALLALLAVEAPVRRPRKRARSRTSSSRAPTPPTAFF